LELSVRDGGGELVLILPAEPQTPDEELQTLMM
jgi:hypothetical protein